MPSSLSSGLIHFSVAWHQPSAAYGTDSVVFTAPYDCVLVAINEVHSVAGSDGGTVYLQATRDTGTNAPGAGTDLLSNNTNNGFDMKGTANTVQYGSFKAGVSRKFAKGERLGIDFAGTVTSLAGVVVTATFYRVT